MRKSVKTEKCDGKKPGLFSGGFSGRVSARAAFFCKAAVFALLLTGCEWFLGPELPAPGDLTATTGKADKIEIAWKAVEKADIYYIYRADSADGEYDYHAFSYSAAYTDTKIAYERPYFYKITAGDMETNNESPKSAAAKGNSTHEYAWSAAATGATGAAQQRLALDRSDPSDDSEAGVVYMAAAADDGTGAVTVYKYNREEGGWAALGEPFGTTDTAEFRVFDICAAGGEVYAAYSDKGLGGKVTVRTYNETDEVWEVFPSAADEGFSSGTNARYLSMDVDGAGTVYVGYVYTNGTDHFIEYASSSDIQNPTSVLGANGPGTSYKLDFQGGVKSAYEDENTPGIITAAGTAVDGTSGQNLRDNYLDFVAVSGSEMYITYFTDALYVKKYNGSDWSTDITPSGISPSSTSSSVALAFDQPGGSSGNLYLFYPYYDLNTGGIVMIYSGTPPAWQILALDENNDKIIDLLPSSIELEAYNNFIYASYLVGSAAQMRVWE
jgi:fibronectin type 3 domain-containing protein